MILSTLIDDIQKLSISDRITLVENIWDSIAPNQEVFSLTEEDKLELDRRLLEYDHDPYDGESWEMIEARVLGR